MKKVLSICGFLALFTFASQVMASGDVPVRIKKYVEGNCPSVVWTEENVERARAMSFMHPNRWNSYAKEFICEKEQYKENVGNQLLVVIPHDPNEFVDYEVPVRRLDDNSGYYNRRIRNQAIRTYSYIGSGVPVFVGSLFHVPGIIILATAYEDTKGMHNEYGNIAGSPNHLQAQLIGVSVSAGVHLIVGIALMAKGAAEHDKLRRMKGEDDDSSFVFTGNYFSHTF
jgi:hypothetical protein